MNPRERRTPDPRRAVGYIRVSTEDQHLGPEAQRAALERFAVAQGLLLVAVHEDRGISGATDIDKRPGLLAALSSMGEHRAGVLVAAKADRIARDVVVAALVERLVARSGARLLFADGTGNGDGPEAQLLRHLVAAFASYERTLIAARTRAALAVLRDRGRRIGGIPYGHRLAADGKHLAPDPDEARIVERGRALRSAGLSLRKIAAALTAEGIRPRGRTWHPESVRSLLRAGGAA
ncbi:MAG: recombinase family protein [Planctomycetes bacterium]|nr:recombinase family protein [Planctomycetota bacterium]